MTEAAASTAIANIAQRASIYLKAIEFVADECLGFTDTVEKTYELVFINEVKEYFVQQYYDDVENYKTASREGASLERRNDLAKKAIDDLIVLKKIQLRANEIAYKMTYSLADESLVGKIEGWIMGENASEGIEYSYNIVKNALVDTMINPFNYGSFVVEEGETLEIITVDNGKNLLGVYTTKDGNRINIAEFQYRIFEGIEVNGTLDVKTNCYTTSIKVNGNINVYNGSTLSCLGLEGNFVLGGNGTLEVDGKFTTDDCFIDYEATLEAKECEFLLT